MHTLLLPGSDMAAVMKMINIRLEDGAMELGDCGSKENTKLDIRLELNCHYQW